MSLKSASQCGQGGQVAERTRPATLVGHILHRVFHRTEDFGNRIASVERQAYGSNHYFTRRVNRAVSKAPSVESKRPPSRGGLKWKQVTVLLRLLGSGSGWLRWRRSRAGWLAVCCPRRLGSSGGRSHTRLSVIRINNRLRHVHASRGPEKWTLRPGVRRIE